MNDDERYLFDLNGFIVIEALLSDAEVGRCNEYIKHQIDSGIAEFEEGADLSGGHKANLPTPPALRRGENYTEHIRKVPVKAGDATIFTETATHGALPWRAAHQRRFMLTRYSPGFIAYHGLKQQLTDPDYFADLTAPQKAVLASPHYRVR